MTAVTDVVSFHANISLVLDLLRDFGSDTPIQRGRPFPDWDGSTTRANRRKRRDAKPPAFAGSTETSSERQRSHRKETVMTFENNWSIWLCLLGNVAYWDPYGATAVPIAMAMALATLAWLVWRDETRS